MSAPTVLVLAVVVALAAAVPSDRLGQATDLKFSRAQQLPEVAQMSILDTCCGDLGCYSAGGDFQRLPDRPFFAVPHCHLRSLLKLHLNTIRNPISTQVLSAYDTTSIQRSNYDATKKMQIIIHGFIDNYQWPWHKATVAELLKNGDHNVIRLDWNFGNLPPYFQASANVRLVGAFVAQFINHLVEQYGASPADFHIIGHSLGAHGAGYTGSVTQSAYGFKIGRITGLDPAGPYFTGLPESVRLHPGDAEFVDTLITDGESILDLALGSPQPMGHVNFYPNGGLRQPGCSKPPLGFMTIFFGTSMDSDLFSPIGEIAARALESMACNHARALPLFYESINHPLCTLTSYECRDYESFKRGECFTCKNGKCGEMGFNADPALGKAGLTKNFYSITTGRSPFCTSPNKIRLRLQSKGSANSNDSKQKSGKLYVTLYGTKGTSSRVELTPKDIDLNPGQTYNFLFETNRDLGELRSVTFHWVVDIFLLNPIDWIRTHNIYLDGNIILTDKEGKVSEFRPSKAKVETEKDVQATFSHSYQQ